MAHSNSKTDEDGEWGEDVQMSDTQGPSSSTIEPMPEPMPKPNQRPLTIASLCNPMNEAVDIRQFQASPLFDKNLDAIHKPSWVEGHSCEKLALSLLFLGTNL
jgi:hypothetical protein